MTNAEKLAKNTVVLSTIISEYCAERRCRMCAFAAVSKPCPLLITEKDSAIEAAEEWLESEAEEYDLENYR